MSDYAFEGTRRITYGDDDQGRAVFIAVCQTCGRFVKAAETIRVRECGGITDEPNAECSKHGAVSMPFEGFL